MNPIIQQTSTFHRSMKCDKTDNLATVSHRSNYTTRLTDQNLNLEKQIHIDSPAFLHVPNTFISNLYHQH